MKPLPTQARALKKRQATLDAAKLEFIERGFEQTTAKSIAARAGVATGTFYQYFANKEEILQVLTRSRFEQLFDSINMPDLSQFKGPSDIQGLRQVFSSVMAYVYDFHRSECGFHEVLEHRRFADKALDALISDSEKVLMKRVEQFVRLYKVDKPEALAFCLFAMAEGLVHRHVFHPAKVSRKAVLSQGVDILSSYFEHLPSNH